MIEREREREREGGGGGGGGGEKGGERREGKYVPLNISRIRVTRYL